MLSVFSILHLTADALLHSAFSISYSALRKAPDVLYNVQSEIYPSNDLLKSSNHAGDGSLEFLFSLLED